MKCNDYPFHEWCIRLMIFCVVTTLFSLTLSAQTLPPIAQLTTQAVLRITINGQETAGVHVHNSDGQIQTWTCQDPKPYLQVNSSMTGWACYDYTVGVWLLDAYPPQIQQASVQVQTVPQPQTQEQRSGGVVVVNQPPIYQPQVIYQHPQTVILASDRPVIGGVGEVIIVPVNQYPIYSGRVAITRDAIRETGRVLSGRVYRGRR